MTDARFIGKSIPQSDFAGDDGLASPELAAALNAHSSGRSDQFATVNAFLGQRIFVPVMAVLDEAAVSPRGHTVEKDSHMATVSVTNPDGRRAMLAFTSVATLSTWSNEARPVASRSEDVAAAALQERADALLVDAGTPQEFGMGAAALIALAEGRAWVHPARDQDVVSDIRAALVSVSKRGFTFELDAETQSADLRLIVCPPSASDPDLVREQVNEISQQLGASPVLRARLTRGIHISVRD